MSVRGQNRGEWGTVAAWMTLVAVVTIDVATGQRVVLTSLTIIAPLLAALIASRRTTAAIALITLLVALLSPLWDHSFPTVKFWLPLTVVTFADGFAIAMSRFRERVVLETRRMGVLAALGEIALPGRQLPEVAQEISALLVPDVYDLCILDHYDAKGQPHRLAGAATGPGDALTRWLARAPAGITACSPGEIPAPHHESRLDAARRDQIAHDAEHAEILQQLALTSSLAIPLQLHGRIVGNLLLGTRHPRRRIEAPDISFAQTLAGRVALVLENAILAAELGASERERETILANIEAAVTVRNKAGELVYANPAAAQLLGVGDVETLMRMRSDETMAHFDVYTEEGDEVSLSELPGTWVLQGVRNPKPVTVRNVIRETGKERWLLNKASAILDTEGEVALAINVTEDITETKRSEITQRILATVAQELAGPTTDAALQRVAEAMVPGLADWAGIDLRQPGGRHDVVAIAHRDPEKAQLGWKLRRRWSPRVPEEDAIGRVMSTGEAELERDIPDELLVEAAQDAEHLETLRAIGLMSTMIVPVRSGDRILGALSFVSSTSRRFDARDLDLATQLGRQIGLLLEAAETNAEQAHIARTLQAGLIPTHLPQVPGWVVSTAYRAAGRANEVGGDFYDVVRFTDGWAALIGDVQGKGAAAAALTATARHTLASVIIATGDAAHALSVLNLRLREAGGDALMLTTAAVLMVRNDGRVSLLSAGHPLPLMRSGREVRAVGVTSPLLGFVDELPLTEQELDIAPGEQLILYTDGVLDATGAGDRFGEQRLRDAVARLADEDCVHCADVVMAEIDAFLVGDQTDDIAVITVTRMPEADVEATAAVPTVVSGQGRADATILTLPAVPPLD